MKRKRDIFNKDTSWGWVTVVVVLIILLMGWFSSCRSKKESVMEYKVESGAVTKAESIEAGRGFSETLKTEKNDTMKNREMSAGEISIERDTAGRPVRIIYLHTANAVQTLRKTKTDTIREKEYIIERDTVEVIKTDTAIEGKETRKTDTRFGVMGLGGFCLLIFAGVVVFFFLVKRFVRKHSEKWQK